MITEVISALGGSIVFLAAIGGLLRGVFRQTQATEDNTKAIQDMSKRIENILSTQNGYDRRITDLELWRRYAVKPADQERP